MRVKVYLCLTCGAVKLQLPRIGEIHPVLCGGDAALVHHTEMAFVHEIDLGAIKGRASEEK